MGLIENCSFRLLARESIAPLDRDEPPILEIEVAAIGIDPLLAPAGCRLGRVDMIRKAPFFHSFEFGHADGGMSGCASRLVRGLCRLIFEVGVNRRLLCQLQASRSAAGEANRDGRENDEFPFHAGPNAVAERHGHTTFLISSQRLYVEGQDDRSTPRARGGS